MSSKNEQTVLHLRRRVESLNDTLDTHRKAMDERLHILESESYKPELLAWLTSKLTGLPALKVLEYAQVGFENEEQRLNDHLLWDLKFEKDLNEYVKKVDFELKWREFDLKVQEAKLRRR